MQLLHSDGTPNWEHLISLIRTTRGIDAEELAIRVQCTTGDLTDWGQGVTQPSPEQAERLWGLSPVHRADAIARYATDPELLGEGEGID